MHQDSWDYNYFYTITLAVLYVWLFTRRVVYCVHFEVWDFIMSGYPLDSHLWSVTRFMEHAFVLLVLHETHI